MTKFKDKINALLKTQIVSDYTLAFQLLQSQWRFSKSEALNYIFEHQILKFWDNKTTEYSFEVEGYKVHVFFQEVDSTYTYDLYLGCTIKTLTQDIAERESLGIFDSDFGFGSEETPTLLESKDIAQKLFARALKKMGE